MTTDYSEVLIESANDGHWKTAKNVNSSEFSQITHRLRYQAATLGLSIKIQTDKQEHTVSFLARKAEKRHKDDDKSCITVATVATGVN